MANFLSWSTFSNFMDIYYFNDCWQWKAFIYEKEKLVPCLKHVFVKFQVSTNFKSWKNSFCKRESRAWGNLWNISRTHSGIHPPQNWKKCINVFNYVILNIWDILNYYNCFFEIKSYILNSKNTWVWPCLRSKLVSLEIVISCILLYIHCIFICILFYFYIQYKCFINSWLSSLWPMWSMQIFKT